MTARRTTPLGFLVSSDGGSATRINPWGSAEARVIKADGTTVMISTMGELTFATETGGI